MKTLVHDSVARAHEDLETVLAEFDKVKQNAIHSRVQWNAAKDCLFQTDPTRQQLQQADFDAQREYQRYFSKVIPDAEAAVRQAEQTILQAAQEQWVRDYRPDDAKEMVKLTAIITKEPHNSRASYNARHAAQQLRFRLQNLWAEYQKECNANNSR